MGRKHWSPLTPGERKEAWRDAKDCKYLSTRDRLRLKRGMRRGFKSKDSFYKKRSTEKEMNNYLSSDRRFIHFYQAAMDDKNL